MVCPKPSKCAVLFLSRPILSKYFPETSSTDAAHFVWMAKANQLYNLEKQQSQIKAKVLFLPSHTDMIFPPELSKRWAEKLRAQGNYVEIYEIEGTSGHLDGLFSIGKVSDQLKAFLTK